MEGGKISLYINKRKWRGKGKKKKNWGKSKTDVSCCSEEEKSLEICV